MNYAEEAIAADLAGPEYFRRNAYRNNAKPLMDCYPGVKCAAGAGLPEAGSRKTVHAPDLISTFRFWHTNFSSGRERSQTAVGAPPPPRTAMDDPDPPATAAAPPTPPPPSSRLQRTLSSLRAPFRSGSPFYIGAAVKRSGSTKSSASDGEPTPRVRIMRKKNKKQKQDANDAGTSRSTDGSPVVESTRKEGFVRRLGSFGRKRGEGARAKVGASRASAPQLEEPFPEPRTPTPPSPSFAPAPASCTRDSDGESIPAIGVGAASAVSDVAVEHPVATKPFTKAAWMRRAPEMERPVEEPSPGDAVRRRIAFVAQASAYLSEDRPEPEEGGSERDEAGRGVGSLEEAVALARARLAHSPSPSPMPRADVDTEEEGCAEDMPPYGDLLEPATGVAPAASVASSPVSVGRGLGRAVARGAVWCARAMTLEVSVDECCLTVCECCGFSAETTVLFPVGV
ncbi:hypothetical protein EVAR_8235_1 [Eumeta japonica]|uniref:Uncharacterized protein n=1 Tax=Eumeta variegata TaxID=151549 RepID=A0A4C1TJ39_EUMVA|nr:hypothetical protein EVAR_8235_1 [Eumeta japonica]